MILRELLLRLGLDIDAQSFARGELAAKVIEKSFEKVVDVAKELAHAFVENIAEAIEYGNRLEKTSQSIGIATDALQELQFAGSLADLSAEEMSQSIGILSRNMNAAKNGGEEAAKAFKGIKFQEGGKLIATDEVLASIADKFEKMPNGAEKTALAMQLFGRAGKQMIPLLNEGSEGLEKMRQEARDLGLVMGEEAIKASAELNDNFDRLRAVTEGLWRSAIAPLLPAINRLVKRFLEWRKANAAIMSQKLSQYIGYAIKAVEALGDTFEFLVKNAGGVKAILIGVAATFLLMNTAAVAAAASTLAAWLLAAAPFILIGGLIAGILLFLDDFRVYQNGGKSLFGLWKKTIDDWLKPNDKDPWFVTAIKDFVQLVKDALKLIDEFNEATGRVRPQEIDRRAGQNKGERQSSTDRITIETARRRVSMGLPLTDPERLALERGGVTEEAFKAKYNPGAAIAPTASFTPEARTPEYRAPYSSGGGMSVSAPVQIGPNIQQPGENSEDFARRVSEHVEEHWNSKMEEASAGVSQ